MKRQIIYSAAAIGLTVLVMALMLGYAARRKAAGESERENPPVQVIQSSEPAVTEFLQQTDDPFSGKLAYRQLSSECRKVYQELYKVMMDQKRGANVSTTDFSELETAYQAVMADHGGIFWVDGYTSEEHYRDGRLQSLTFFPIYGFSAEDRKLYQGYVDEVMEDYMARISPDASAYEKVKYVYEMLIFNVDYDVSVQENQNILSVFLWGRSVCSGFAGAAQYMLTKLKVPSMIVYGESMGEKHAWNLVYVDGNYYYLDATWGNTASKALDACSYEYLCLNDRQIAPTHSVDMLFELPPCESQKDNYFVHEGLYLQEYDPEAFGNFLKNGWDSGQKAVSVMFSSENLLNSAKKEFITEEKILEYCEGIGQVRYIVNEDLHVLSILLEQGTVE